MINEISQIRQRLGLWGEGGGEGGSGGGGTGKAHLPISCTCDQIPCFNVSLACFKDLCDSVFTIVLSSLTCYYGHCEGNEDD